MIVISGALVLVALVLLVLGLTMTDLDFVYGSIGVSLVSFVFLVIGILQRRGEPAGSPAPTVSDDAAAADTADQKAAETPVGASGRPVPQHVPAVTTADGAPAPRTTGRAPVVEEDDEELLPGGGPVLVVEGRPRYHVEGCRYLTGRTAEELDVLDARDDGFTACGVCKPDQVLEELYGPIDEVLAEADEVGAPVDEPAEDDDVLDTGVPGAGDDEPAPVSARRGRAAGSARVDLDEAVKPAKATKAAAKATKAPAKAAKATKAPAKVDEALKPAKAAKAPAKADPAPAKAAKAPAKTSGRSAAKAAPATTASADPAPAKAAKAPKTGAAPATEPAAATAAAPAASARGKVVVIPDRDRFHVATCRFVRDAEGTEQLTRAQAGKQGYRACGVCKP